jgi:hypothetical protein
MGPVSLDRATHPVSTPKKFGWLKFVWLEVSRKPPGRGWAASGLEHLGERWGSGSSDGWTS